MTPPLQALVARYVAPARRRLAAGWQWWRDQLLEMLPASLNRALATGGERLVIECDEHRFRISSDAADGRELIVTRGAGGECTADLPTGPGQVVLVLPANRVLVRRLTLPLATEENLREAVAFQIDLQTPFEAENVHFDCNVVDRRPDAQALDADLVVVPRSFLDPVLDELDALDLAPTSACVAAATGEPLPANLLPASRRRQAGRAFRPGRTGILLAANACLLLLAVTLPILQKTATIADLEPRLQQAIAEAREGARLRDEVERLDATSVYLQDKKQRTVFAMTTLNEVTRLLPDHTWLSRIDIDNRELQLQGQSSSSASLIQVLEASPMLANVRFRSPVTRIGSTDDDSFHLSADIVGASER